MTSLAGSPIARLFTGVQALFLVLSLVAMPFSAVYAQENSEPEQPTQEVETPSDEVIDETSIEEASDEQTDTEETETSDENNLQPEVLGAFDVEGHSNPKVDICHKPGTPAANILNVDANGWNGHSGHQGDYLITNENRANCVPITTVIVKKVIVGNGNASPDDFKFKSDKSGPGGVANYTFEEDGENNLALGVGTFDIEEKDVTSDYSVSYTGCDDIVITENTTTPVTCTITNTYTGPKLVVKKIIVGNEDASPNDFSFTVTVDNKFEDDEEIQYVFDADGEVEIPTTYESLFFTGFPNYTVIENSAENYTTTYDGCEDVTFSKFGDKTKICTITNTYVPPAPTCDVNATFMVVSNGGELVDEEGSAVETWEHSAWLDESGDGAKWIWSEAQVSNPSATSTHTFSEEFSIIGTPKDSTLYIAADNGYIAKINGETICSAESNTPNYGSYQTCAVDAEVLQNGVNTLSVEVTNASYPTEDYQTNPGGVIYKLTVNEDECVIPDSEETAEIHATKIVCSDESYLPNRMGESHSTDADTAAEFLAAVNDGHEVPVCWPEAGWQFEWGNQSAPDAGGDFVGHAEGYTISGLTGEDGTVTMSVPLENVSEIRVRELLQEGYVPFAYDSENQSNENTFSAELSCSNDGLNYDNWDYIRNPEDTTYYCVAWNALKEKPQTCNPEINLVANGGFENPDVGTGSYDIVEDVNLDAGSVLDWLVSWTNPQEGGRLGLEIQDHVAGTPAEGAQHAELDGDHPVTISQTLATVPGQDYAVSFKYSPRAGRNAADNTILVKADGVTLGAPLATDGTANGDTVWESLTRSFTATDDSTVLEFADTGTDTSYGGYLDDVSVTCVPEVPKCDEDEHLENNACVPNEDQCDVDAEVVLLSSDNDGEELYTTDEDGPASLVAVPHVAWADAVDALWIWKDTTTSNEDADVGTTETFTRTFTIVGEPLDASLDMAVDNSVVVRVNGDILPTTDEAEFNYVATSTYTVPASMLNTGVNTITFTVTNMNHDTANDPANNPGGLLYKLTTHDNQCEDGDDGEDNGTIVIVKNTEGGDGTFNFNVDPTELLVGDVSPEATITTDEETHTGTDSVEVAPGAYLVSEVAQDGWTLDDVSCVEGNEQIPTGVSLNDGYVYVSEGETVTCTFWNTKDTDDTTPTPPEERRRRRGGSHHVVPEVLGATTCSPLLPNYLGINFANDPEEVKLLQNFLNGNLGINLPLTGFFGPMTKAAVEQFQVKYGNAVLVPWVPIPDSGIVAGDDATGLVYKTTKWQINNLVCPGSEAMPTLP